MSASWSSNHEPVINGKFQQLKRLLELLEFLLAVLLIAVTEPFALIFSIGIDDAESEGIEEGMSAYLINGWRNPDKIQVCHRIESRESLYSRQTQQPFLGHEPVVQLGIFV